MQTLRQQILRIAIPVVAAIAILASMGGTWTTARATPPPIAGGSAPPKPPPPPPPKATGLVGKLNLNTATEEQLRLLPTVGPSKAERIVTWRKKNGGFKRTADLRRVKGFGFKTFKRLEPWLDIVGDTTLSKK